MRSRKTKKGEPSRWKLLLWTAVASLVFGLIGLGELPEDILRTARNKLHPHAASGDAAHPGGRPGAAVQADGRDAHPIG